MGEVPLLIAGAVHPGHVETGAEDHYQVGGVHRSSTEPVAVRGVQTHGHEHLVAASARVGGLGAGRVDHDPIAGDVAQQARRDLGGAAVVTDEEDAQDPRAGHAPIVRVADRYVQ